MRIKRDKGVIYRGHHISDRSQFLQIYIPLVFIATQKEQYLDDGEMLYYLMIVEDSYVPLCP